MTAEHYELSPVNPVLMTSWPSHSYLGYYRSKLYIAPYSANTLIAAASPVLSLLERLCLSATLPPVEQIRENIEHELRAFHSKLCANKYPTELASIGFYLLTATIDELIGKNYLRVSQPIHFKSFTPISANAMEPQHYFFEIIRFIKERPNQFLDVIELAYFCLVTGFEGAYHLKAEGRYFLDNTIEDLYQIIQQHRVHKSYRLFNENPFPTTVKRNYKMPILAALVALGVVAFTLVSSHLILEHKAKSVLFGHTQLALLDS